LQLTVAGSVGLWLISVTEHPGPPGQGRAIGILMFLSAFAVTWLLSKAIDLLKH
jgi:hypothetical protein